jgi:hypothetical protein
MKYKDRKDWTLKLVMVQVPLNYPFVECFPLAMLAMSHPDFPFPVLGAVLARNTTRCSRPITLEDKLIFRYGIQLVYYCCRCAGTTVLLYVDNGRSIAVVCR